MMKDDLFFMKSRKPLTILSLLLSMGETSAPYNEHCLARAHTHKMFICTLLQPQVTHPKEIILFEGDGSVIGFMRILKDALDENEYDIIHAHSSHVGFLFLVVRLLRLRKSTPATVFTVHSSYPNYKLRNRLLLIPVFAFFKKVICCSMSSYDSFPTFYKWLAGKRLSIIPNGTDIERIDRVITNQKDKSQNGTFTITTVGRLIESKNPISILESFQQSETPDSHLIYIGEGHLRNKLLTKLEETDLGNQVELTGLIPRDQVYKVLAKTDLYISQSQVEGLPVSVMEAMACRCPVILSDIPPHREIAESTNFIPLIYPNDVAGFAREIKRFKQLSPAKRAEIGENSRRLIEDRFSLTKMHKQYEEVYYQLLEESSNG